MSAEISNQERCSAKSKKQSAKPVGFGSIRHFLTDALRKEGGNIGYGIAPKYRGRGYGKKILGLLLEEANRLGIDRALVTIQLDNAASRAVALANGGVITGQTDERILVWIDTANIPVHKSACMG